MGKYYMGNGCFDCPKEFGYREKGVYLPIVTALNRGKWENRSEGQKVEVLVTHSGENLSVTNA